MLNQQTATISHFSHPYYDCTLCGDADEGGINLEEQPIANYGDIVTCKRCLQIIVACKQYSPVSEGGKGVPRIVVSCWSCRKNKGCLDTLTAKHLISCKYRFGEWADEPCENWLPGKETIRIKIMRAVEGIHDIDMLWLDKESE